MKKIVLSLAGVLAATAFAPEASAVPAFARQVGMGCTACHQQHFPILNSFGQSFKAGGYTMMGAQGKIEGEHMSIPDTLNASIVLKARYQDANGTDAAGTLSGETTNSGQWQLPDEFALLLGGRAAENAGFLIEAALGGTDFGVVAGFKMPFVFDAGGAKLSVIPYMTDGLGTAYGYELSSTGAVRNVRWSEHRKETSAAQYTGIGGSAATGLALVAQGDMGYINFSRWSPNFLAAAGTSAIQLKSNYLRIAATPTVGNWAMHIGGQFASGTNYEDGTGTLGAGGTFKLVETKASAFDFQGFTQVGGKDLGVYATWSKANATAAGTTPNLFNSNARDKTAWTVAADYSVIPNALHLAVAYRNAENGKTTANGENAVTLQAIYDMQQNVALHLIHSSYSGSAYDAAGKADQLTTFMLEAAW